jgi:hypothetical protein
MQKAIGRVVEYGANPQGDIDKILVKTNDQQIWLHFPPHTAKKVLELAVIQAIVSTTYSEEVHGKGGMMHNELRTIGTSKDNLVNLQSILPPPPSDGKNVWLTGSKYTIREDSHGRTTGFEFGGKYIVLPPHIAGELLPKLSVAGTIEVKGKQRSDQDGFVNMYGGLVRPEVIIIDNMNYLVQ